MNTPFNTLYIMHMYNCTNTTQHKIMLNNFAGKGRHGSHTCQFLTVKLDPLYLRVMQTMHCGCDHQPMYLLEGKVVGSSFIMSMILPLSS